MDDAPSHAVPVECPKAASSSSTEAHGASLFIPRKQSKKTGNSSKRKQYRRNRKFLEFVDGEVLEEENKEMRIFLYTDNNLVSDLLPKDEKFRICPIFILEEISEI